jgi:DUF1680 family protein
MRANSEGYLEHVNPQELLNDPVSAGLFLIAAANSHDYSEDPNLRRVMDSVGRAIIKHPPPANEPRVQASLIAGLVAYGEETGDDDALAAAQKVADAHFHDAAPMLIGPLTNLYRAAEEQRYLDAARSLASREPPTNMVDRFVYAIGLVSYYRQSGDDAALKKSEQLWHSVQPTITGAPEVSCDSCATAAWFEWTTNLLRATGKIEYAEALETTLYNQLLAAQEPQSGVIFESVPLSGTKGVSAATSNCSAAEAWALADLPEAIWGRLNNGIAIMNYSPGRASFRLRRRTSVQIYSEGNYPETSDLLIHVEPSKETRFRVFLRVPRWSKNFIVQSGATRQIGKPGEFVNLVREWKKGDTIRISIENPVIAKRDPAQPAIVALQRGPQVLAAVAQIKGRSQNLSSLVLTGKSEESLTMFSDQAAPSPSMSEAMFETTALENGAPAKLLLVPFAAAVGEYRVWLPKH